VRKNTVSMLHVWAMADHRNEFPTLEEFLNMCPLYIS
jgi:hypothetical protein